MTTIIIADDHAIFRRGLRCLLKSMSGVFLLGEATDGCNALELIKAHTPNIALLDMNMPEMTGIEVTLRVKQQNIKTRCILMTLHREPGFAREAIKTGALGCLLKDNIFEELALAVQAVAKGEKYVSPVIANGLKDF